MKITIIKIQSPVVITREEIYKTPAGRKYYKGQRWRYKGESCCDFLTVFTN